METLILATVLLSGYVFCRQNPYYYFQLEKTSGLITYLMAGALGLCFCLASGIATVLLIAVTGVSVNSPLCSFCPYIDYFGFFFILWALLSFGLAAIFGFSHRFSSNKIKKAFERICEDSTFRSKIYEGFIKEKLFQVTLRNNKVYVGQVVTVSPELLNSKMEYFSLCPIMSGYRSKTTHRIKFTNSYLTYYLSQKKKMKSSDAIGFYKLLDEFTVVIPVSEICLLGYFDPVAYKEINEDNK